MKNARVWITLSGGLASGLLAGYLALVYVSEEPAPLKAEELKGTQIVVAGRDLATGTILTREDLEIIDWPSGNLPDGFFSQPGEVVGRGVIGEVRRNEPLLDEKLALKEAGGGLPITIPAGYRAVSVEVDEVIGVAGFTLPGTLVDVLATVMPGTN
ncbi:MAG: Flp pilus assembly protein CpaB, partial [Gemmatimonadota bacterium]